ncbi:unnamed protein product [Mucor fragilis]
MQSSLFVYQVKEGQHPSYPPRTRSSPLMQEASFPINRPSHVSVLHSLLSNVHHRLTFLKAFSNCFCFFFVMTLLVVTEGFVGLLAFAALFAIRALRSFECPLTSEIEN